MRTTRGWAGLGAVLVMTPSHVTAARLLTCRSTAFRWMDQSSVCAPPLRSTPTRDAATRRLVLTDRAAATPHPLPSPPLPSPRGPRWGSCAGQGRPPAAGASVARKGDRVEEPQQGATPCPPRPATPRPATPRHVPPHCRALALACPYAPGLGF